MSNSTTLSKLVDSAAEKFAPEGPFCRDELAVVLDGLQGILVDCDHLEFAVVDNLWQAARRLQNSLEDDRDLDEQVLSGIFEQMVTAADLMASDAGGATDEAQGATQDYLIPEEDVSLVEDFIVEANEHLEAAEAALLELEHNPEDSDVLNLIFRAFHTIKGMAGFMNLEEIGSLAHVLENLLDKARKGELLLAGRAADAIFQGIDLLKTMGDGLRTAIESDCVVRPQSGLEEMTEFVTKVSEEGPDTVDEFSALEGYQDAFESEASQNGAADTEADADAEDKAEELIARVDSGSEARKSEPQQAKSNTQVDEKIKVSTSRLDNLVNLVGELVIAQLMVGESLKSAASDNEALLRNASHQGKIIRELQELSMSMRMVPISGLFQKMARMTRDLSRRADKEINFITQGDQTELDRTIVDKVADPLVHMIRNSVDHGIERKDERLASGKQAAGRIELRAFHLGGNIVIEIEDDGRGISREKLLTKAIEKGLVAPDRSLSEQETFNLIFHPGFSTAEKVTTISGRGVGMDVVKRNIEDLRGRIDIASTPGEGTIFTITLPLTLAVIDGQVIRVGSEKFIIPINSIRRTFRPEESQISTVYGKGEVVKLRDELFPMVRLNQLFDIAADASEVTEGLFMIVEQDNQACCLFIDDLLDQQQVVIKSLGGILSNITGISGGAIMGDGNVRLILDIPGIIKLYRN